MISDYDGCKDWKLVNDFTIHEDRNLSSGRPFMLTCVPQRLYMDLTNLKAIHSVEWQDSDRFGDDENEEDTPRTYIQKNQIYCTAEIEDRIAVFSVGFGVVKKFESIKSLYIRPIEPGTLGGKNNANSMTGTGFSGMSSREVPEKGLMEGEIGSLYYMDTKGDDFTPRREQGRNLYAELYLDQDQFSRLFDKLVQSSDRISEAKLALVVELFQAEMDASLSEPWMTQDYGLHLKGDPEEEHAFAQTRARIERLSISYAQSSPVNSGEDTEDNIDDFSLDYDDEDAQADQKPNHNELMVASMAQVVSSSNRVARRLAWVVFVMVILLIAVVGSY